MKKIIFNWKGRVHSAKDKNMKVPMNKYCHLNKHQKITEQEMNIKEDHLG